jgi:hypothetical protein
MKTFVKLTLISVAMVIVTTLYFEYCVNRPLNIYLQYAATAAMILTAAAYLLYMVKQILKLLNP